MNDDFFFFLFLFLDRVPRTERGNLKCDLSLALDGGFSNCLTSSLFFFHPGIWCAHRWRLLMDSFNQKLTRKYKGKRVGTGPGPRVYTQAVLHVGLSAAVLWDPCTLCTYCSCPGHLIITVRLRPKRFMSYFGNRILYEFTFSSPKCR